MSACSAMIILVSQLASAGSEGVHPTRDTPATMWLTVKYQCRHWCDHGWRVNKEVELQIPVEPMRPFNVRTRQQGGECAYSGWVPPWGFSSEYLVVITVEAQEEGFDFKDGPYTIELWEGKPTPVSEGSVRSWSWTFPCSWTITLSEKKPGSEKGQELPIDRWISETRWGSLLGMK